MFNYLSLASFCTPEGEFCRWISLPLLLFIQRETSSLGGGVNGM
jgi:hypothetical protein